MQPYKRKNKQFPLFLFLLAAVFLLHGCGDARPPLAVADTAAANPDAFRIVTSFYPMHVLTRNIAGNIQGVTIRNMTGPQTGCLHDYQLRPSDLKALENADAFVINGAGMEAFLNNVLEQYPTLPVIEAARGIPLLQDENGESNPHIWVSVSGAIAEVAQISSQLSAADPAHADAYTANAGEYAKRLQALSQKMHDSLAPFAGSKIVTFHEAFPYFADEFDLEIAAVIEREPGSEPGAGELADTIGIIRSNEVKALFAEPQFAPKAAETIAEETGATVYSLDPFVTGSENDPADSYETVMLRNMEVLVQALTKP